MVGLLTPVRKPEAATKADNCADQPSLSRRRFFTLPKASGIV
jgi:hypothetical protein